MVIRLRLASAFAEASIFAEATTDEMARQAGATSRRKQRSLKKRKTESGNNRKERKRRAFDPHPAGREQISADFLGGTLLPAGANCNGHRIHTA
ncbi:MAG TPA: hypothetical protein VGI03_10325 [Verrucomicrobiae bacterium]|jgi:hypothetical protein